MSFSSQRTVCYLIDQFNYCLLIVCIKTSAELKRQLFDDSDSEKRAPRVYKRLRIDESDDEEQDLDEYEGEVDEYVPLPPVFLPPPPQKESNRSSDLDERTKSLTHLVCIPKTASQRITNFASEFPGRGDSKPKKKFYTSCLTKSLEAYLASTTSTASGTTNHHCLIRERLESYPSSNHCKGLGA